MLCLLWAHGEGIPSPRALRNRQVQTFSRTPSWLAVVHWPPSDMSLLSQPQSSPWDLTSEAQASATSPHPPWRVSRQASRAGECWLAPILCAGISPLCPLHLCCCALLRGSEASPRHPPSLPVKGLPSVWKLFLFHSSLPLVQVLSLFFCLCFFFFLLLYAGIWGFSCLLGNLRSSASVQ